MIGISEHKTRKVFQINIKFIETGFVQIIADSFEDALQHFKDEGLNHDMHHEYNYDKRVVLDEHQSKERPLYENEIFL